jgi:uncharacterized membrane protein
MKGGPATSNSKHVRKENNVSDVKAKIRSNILAGLAVVIPLGLTFYVLDTLIVTTDKLFLLVPGNIDIAYLRAIPGISILLALIFLFITGAIARNYFGNAVVRTFNKMLDRIPIIASIYKTLRQITESFIGQEGKKGFQKVVYVEWPRQGAWTLAFVTANAGQKFFDTSGFDQAETYYNLFIPTTPNPTSGFYFIVKASECIETSLTAEDAFKTIISAGALND